MSTRRETTAREALDAIRLAIEGAANDRAAVMVIRMILTGAPPPNPQDTMSVRRLLRAIKRTRTTRLVVPAAVPPNQP